MRKSNRLRVSDVERALSLVHQCRDLWAEPERWRKHLLAGLCQLTGQAVGHYIEFRDAPPAGVRVLTSTDCGWRDEAARGHFLRFMATPTLSSEPFPGFRQLLAELRETGQAAALRPDICGDDIWNRSTFYNEYRRPAFNEGYAMHMACRRADGLCTYLSVHQDTHLNAPPTLRTKRIVTLVNRHLLPLVGTRLATEEQRSRQGLSPQLQQTLNRLLAGEEEREIADYLLLRPNTAHEYVKKVYRHFQVKSRAELMAYFLQRKPVPKQVPATDSV